MRRSADHASMGEAGPVLVFPWGDALNRTASVCATKPAKSGAERSALHGMSHISKQFGAAEQVNQMFFDLSVRDAADTTHFDLVKKFENGRA